MGMLYQIAKIPLPVKSSINSRCLAKGTMPLSTPRIKQQRDSICSVIQSDEVGVAWLAFAEASKGGRANKQRYCYSLGMYACKCGPISR